MWPATRQVRFLVAAAAGATSGFLGSFLHALTTYGVPVGLVVGLVLSASIVVTTGFATHSRAGGAAAAAGWLLTVALLAVRRPEGDLIVPATPLGLAWLIGGSIVTAAAAFSPSQRLLRPASSGGDAASR